MKTQVIQTTTKNPVALKKTNIPYSQTPRTWEEIEKHNTKSDCWIVIDNKVYDVNKFLKNEIHPGGEVIFTYAGKDATDVFDAYHPKYVWQKKLIKCQCGVVADPRPVPQMVQEYRELHKQLELEGLYKQNWFWWGFKFTYPFLLCALSLYILWNYNSFWTTIVAAILLGLFQQQSAFIAHDASHQGVTMNWSVDYLISLLYGTAIFGVSSLWWKYTHNQHHVVCNEFDRDPDITHLPFFAVDKRMFLEKKKGQKLNFFGKCLIWSQYYTFFPIMILAARFSMIYQCFYMFIAKRVNTMRHQPLHLPWNWILLELLSMAIHWTYLMLIIFYLVPQEYRLWFYFFTHCTVGFLHVQLVLNHWERPTKYSTEEQDNWFVKQVVTGNNIDGNIFTEWFYGGLHFQIEHHLYPRMPRHNLRKAKKYVVEFCKKWNIPYSSMGFWESVFAVMNSLKQVSYYAFAEQIDT